MRSRQSVAGLPLGRARSCSQPRPKDIRKCASAFVDHPRSLAAFAADVSGAWKGSLETPMGDYRLTMNVKADGNVLSGP